MKTRAAPSLALALLLTAFLPSCLTHGVWNNLGPQDWERTVTSTHDVPTTARPTSIPVRLAQVALTPFALAVDVVVTPIASIAILIMSPDLC